MLEILGLVALVVAAFAVAVYLMSRRQPDHFHYARSITMAAPPERIMPLIAAPRAMNTWNPFATDPSSKGEYTGPGSGPGAAYHFAGRSGTGRCEVTDVEPGKVRMRLVMTKPMACDNTVELTLEPKGTETVVTWAMHGTQTRMGRVMNVFIDCERMCGRQFEKGLADLKAKVETAPASAAA